MMVPGSVVSRGEGAMDCIDKAYSLEIVKDRIILCQASGKKIGQRECAKNERLGVHDSIMP